MTKSGLFCMVVIITASIYDLVAVTRGGVDASISRWFQVVGFSAPFQLLVIGYILGHFFSPMQLTYRIFRVYGVGTNNTKHIISIRQPTVEQMKRATGFDNIYFYELESIVL